MEEKDLHSKQYIKSQRVRSYFVQAAKEIVLSEGVENVSVRKVAELAGYTFTTIYNYFTDLNELLHEVKNVMIQDLMIHMQSVLPDKIYDLEDIKKLNRLYVEYFMKRTTVFSFFYSYRLHPIKETPVDIPDFSKLYVNTYRGFVLSGVIKEVEVPVIAKTLIYTLHGLLAIYFSDNGLSEENLFTEIDQITDYLLKGRSET